MSVARQHLELIGKDEFFFKVPYNFSITEQRAAICSRVPIVILR